MDYSANLSEQQSQFLDAMATQLNFGSDTLTVFLNRFDKANRNQDNSLLAIKITWSREPEDKAQKFQDELTKICRVFEGAGCPIEKPKRGRQPKGKSPWEQAFKWLWEIKFIEWQQRQVEQGGEEKPIAIRTIDALGNQDLLKKHYSELETICQNIERPFLAPPKPTYRLIGRDNLFTYLKEQLFAKKCLALNGLPGIGKTALAVELANDSEILEQFPDGILWAGLGRQPDLLAHLGTWAVKLGISQVEIAKLSNIEAWAKAIHTAIGMRRMLLIVDDAWQAEAALAFKLGGPNCAHLLTSRIPGIAMEFAGEDVTTVKELSEGESLMLLTQLAPKVVEAEPDVAKSLVQAVDGLPLALIIMGKYLQRESYSGQPRRLHRALERLRKAEERLRLTQSQSPLERQPSLPMDTPLSLMAVIEISDDALDKASSNALRTLSVFPPKPNTFSEEAALIVCAAPIEALDNLSDSGLLESSEPGRYTLHQTISDYSRLKLTDEIAYNRMIDFFVHYVKTHLESYSALDLEINNILHALQVAFERGMDIALVRGANMLSRFLEIRGMYRLAEIHLNRAQQASRSLGDTDGLITALGNLGLLATHHGEYTQALNYYQEVLLLAHKLGRSETISVTLANLGIVATNLGDYEKAETILQEGLEQAQKLKDCQVICCLMINLGTVCSKQGKYRKAEEYYQKSLTLTRDLKNQEYISTILEGLGVLAVQQGDDLQSEKYFLESLTIAKEKGHSERILSLLTNLSAVKSNLEDYVQMKDYLQQGLDIAKKTEHRLYESAIMCNFGLLYLNQQKIDSASKAFLESLKIAEEAGIPEQAANAMYCLAKVAAAKCNPFEMNSWAQKSLALFQSIGHHRATEVKQWLDIYNSSISSYLSEFYSNQQE